MAPSSPMSRSARRRPSRGAIGATVLALTGLATTYAQMLRSPSAYAAACSAVTNESTFTTALQAVAAGTCDTINITAGFTLTANGYAVDLSSGGTTAVAINGNGNTINGGRVTSTPGSGFRPFNFTFDAGDTLAISDLTIDGAYADSSMGYGGAIRVEGGSAVTLTEVTVTDTLAYDKGGAIFTNADDLTIADSTFSRNESDDDDGGDVYFYGDNDFTITNSSFTGGKASDGGGSIYMSGGTALTISDSSFTDNYSSGDGGGAIYLSGGGTTVTITDSTFTGNSTLGDGGAISVAGYYTYLTLDGVIISDSEAVYGGAGLSTGVQTTITDSVFDNNRGTDSGGAIRADGGTITATRTTFVDNQAGIYDSSTPGLGGAIWTTEDLVLDRVSIVGNSSSGGAGAIAGDGSVSLVNSTVTDNSGEAGVISAGIDVTLSFTTVYDNTIATGGTDTALIVGGDLDVLASLIFNGSTVGDECDVTGTGTLDYAVTTDSTCGTATNSVVTTAAAGLKLGALLDNGDPGGMTLVPGTTSTLATAAPDTDLGTGVTEDQVGTARGPSGTARSFTIGARQPGDAPAWADASPPTQVKAGTAFSYDFRATGTAPMAYKVGSGSVPTGLTLNPSTGRLSGTPTKAGSYSFAIVAQNDFGTATTPTVSMQVVSASAPATPRRPQILAKPGRVEVTVAPGSGGTAAARFVVTASPGGGQCTVTGSRGGTCTVTGLDDGTAYALTAVAVSADGARSDRSAASETAIPGATPTPLAQRLAARIGPGKHAATQGGRSQRVAVDPNATDNALVATADTWSLRLSSQSDGGKRSLLADGTVLVLQDGGAVRTRGQGFKPGSQVRVYLDPPVRGRTEAMRLATLTVDDSGAFTGSADIPAGIAGGNHVVQVVGISRGNEIRALSVGVHIGDLPGSVRDLEASWQGDALHVMWAAPRTSPYDTVTGYRVAVRLALMDDWRWHDRTSSTHTTLDGIDSRCSVVVRVAAVTAAGPGPWRSVTVAGTHAGRSGLPVGDLRCR